MKSDIGKQFWVIIHSLLSNFIIQKQFLITSVDTAADTKKSETIMKHLLDYHTQKYQAQLGQIDEKQ